MTFYRKSETPKIERKIDANWKPEFHYIPGVHAYYLHAISTLFVITTKIFFSSLCVCCEHSLIRPIYTLRLREHRSFTACQHSDVPLLFPLLLHIFLPIIIGHHNHQQRLLFRPKCRSSTQAHCCFVAGGREERGEGWGVKMEKHSAEVHTHTRSAEERKRRPAANGIRRNILDKWSSITTTTTTAHSTTTTTTTITPSPTTSNTHIPSATTATTRWCALLLGRALLPPSFTVST